MQTHLFVADPLVHPRSKTSSRYPAIIQMSIVAAHKTELEELGEHLKLANLSTGWFAIYPNRLKYCRGIATSKGRSDFHLIVYRTCNGQERDHWAIPFEAIAENFVESTLTHSPKTGVYRWNCTLRDHRLHVSHTDLDLDVSAFYGVALPIEAVQFEPTLPEEILSGVSFVEGAVTRVIVNRYERDRDARQQCVNLHGAVCSICKFDFASTYGEQMRGFIHVHHLTPIHMIGTDYTVSPVTDLIPVCPNCHAVIHSRREPIEPAAVLSMLRRTRRANNGAAGQREGRLLSYQSPP